MKFSVPGYFLAAAAALALASPSLADTITFETAPFGGGFSGPVTENGYTYSTLSGGLYVNHFGNPGQDLEGAEANGGGVVKIVAAGGGDFTFAGLDFAAYAGDGTGTQTLIVNGLLGGGLVATDSYTLANTSTFSPNYGNWTTEFASALAGTTIDELDITLDAGETNGSFQEAIDNVVLAAAVPEPASLALLGASLAGLSIARRRMKA